MGRKMLSAMCDDDLTRDSFSEVYLPGPELEKAWRSEAAALLEQIRSSRICVFLSLPPRQRGRIRCFLDCFEWAGAFDTLICFDSRRGKPAIRAKFAELEEHILHNLQHPVGRVVISRVIQESDDLIRDVTQAPIFFPDTGIAWKTGQPEPDRQDKRWLHSAEATYEITPPGQPPTAGNRSRVIHIGYSSPSAWPLFMMPHRLTPTMVILKPRQGLQ